MTVQEYEEFREDELIRLRNEHDTLYDHNIDQSIVESKNIADILKRFDANKDMTLVAFVTILKNIRLHDHNVSCEDLIQLILLQNTNN